MDKKEIDPKLVEPPCRLSESLLWPLIQSGYKEWGIDAWTSDGTPFQISNSPILAENYTRLFEGFLWDCGENSEIDDSSPIYIFDLGAGLGKFAYRILQKIEQLQTCLEGKPLDIRYVMTDIVQENLDFARKHERMKPFVEKGILDFAIFNPVEEDSLTLQVSGDTLNSKSMQNPLLCTANYFFDTLHQDAFRIHKDGIDEGLVHIRTETPWEKEKTDPSLIEQMNVSFKYERVDDIGSYYPEQEFNDILNNYHEAFNDAVVKFYFPIGGFRCIENLRKLSNDSLMIVTGDKCMSHPELIKTWNPGLSFHKTFSCAVNTHILGRYYNVIGGNTLFSKDPAPDFQVTPFLLNKNVSSFHETTMAYRQIDRFTPYKNYMFLERIESQPGEMELDLILDFIELQCYDPPLLSHFYHEICRACMALTPAQSARLLKAIDGVWENHYPIYQGDHEIPFAFGLLLAQMQEHERALYYFSEAAKTMSDNPDLFKAMGLCHEFLGDQQQSQAFYEKASSLAP